MMSTVLRVLRVLMFIAASCLVTNDCARLIFSFNEEYVASQLRNYNQQQENNEANAFSFFEEEVKHKELCSFLSMEVVAEDGLETFVAHLIKDDEVRHLAFMPIFSPPPNLA